MSSLTLRLCEGYIIYCCVTNLKLRGLKYNHFVTFDDFMCQKFQQDLLGDFASCGIDLGFSAVVSWWLVFFSRSQDGFTHLGVFSSL